MSTASLLTSALGLLALGARTVVADDSPTCVSYGMDFQDGGSYFQNSLSSDDFTFVSQFEGCQNDTAANIFISPSGDQTLCSDTNLQPDDTNQLSTCPITKGQLYSGDWSVVIISNNGDAAPIAYERDFSLSVGPQSTSTYIPTITISTVTTPLATSTIITTTTITTNADPSTVTSPSTTATPTKTVTPPPVLTTVTKAFLTLTFTSYTATINQVTKTKTATCKAPTRAARGDRLATIKITVGPAATPISHRFRRAAEEQKANFVAARAARLAARAPDPQPLVVTDTNTSDYVTTTTTSTAGTSTITSTSTALTTTTVIPAPVTVYSGKATAKVVTITKPALTISLTKHTIATSVTTKTLVHTVTITTTTTPDSVKKACQTAGGILY